MRKNFLILFVVILMHPVDAQGIDSKKLLPSIMSPEHRRYAETGKASLKGSASVRLPDNLSSRCSPLDTVTLVPDTPFFRAFFSMLSNGHKPPQWSPDEQQFMGHIVRSTTCNMDSQFRFDNLPALPYMVVTHLVVILGSVEKDVLRHVVLQPGKTLEVKLSEADIIRPGIIEAGPLPDQRDSTAAVGDCETIAINLDLLQTEMSQWRDKSTEISNLQSFWFSEGSRIYKSLVPKLSETWMQLLKDEGLAAKGELVLENVKKDIAKMLRSIEAELVRSSGGRPLTSLTKDRLRQLLWPYLLQGEIIKYAGKVMTASNLLGYVLLAYELLEKEIIPLIHLLEAASVMSNLGEIQQQLATWNRSILQRRQKLMAAAIEKGC